MPGYRAADAPLLLVEDNVRDAVLIQTYLRRDGDAVRWVDRLSSGLEIVRGQAVAEILLDLDLPDSEGILTLKRMLDAAPTVPIVVVSGADDPEFVGRVLEAGASHYLVKGRFDAEVLRSVVDKLRQRPQTRADFIAAENRFRAILTTIQEGMAALDANGVITYVNDQMAEFLQRSPHEIMGRPPTQFLDERSARIGNEPLKPRKSGHASRSRLSFVRPDGSKVTLSVCATPLFDALGRNAGSVATFLEVNDQRVREEELLTILDCAKVGVFVTVNSIFLFVNPVFARMLGYAQDDLIGRNSLELVVEEDRDLFLNGDDRDAPRLVRLVGRQGAIKTLRLQTTTTRAREGMKVVGTAHNLTEVMEDIETKTFLASIVESSSDAIVSCDLRGLTLTWNRSAERILGYSAEEMVGRRDVGCLVPADLAGEADSMIRKMLDSQQVEHFETRRLTKSGQEIAVSISLAPLRNRRGSIVGIAAILREVTGQKSADRQLEQQTRMSSLGRMASSIAHEFNNVLMGIQPFAEVMERTSSEERVRKAAGQIRNSVRRGKAVAEEILRFGNPRPPALQSIALRHWLFSSIRPELQALFSPGVDLNIDIPQELHILGDPSQMAQVVMNLAINSRHSMPRGGVFSIRASRCRPGERFRFASVPSPERFVHIEIEDTGTGMNQATLERIFEPLFTTKSGGNGLGLPLVHQIIERHGGHVFVESTPNVGTIFHVLLVSAHASTSAGELKSYATARTFSNLRVLIVEDDLEIAEGLEELFHFEGIECDLVHDAAEAVPATERFGPDLVLLDVTLGEDSGLDVYEAIARRWPDLPVIFSTGTGAVQQIQSLTGANVTLLQKAYDFARLTAEIGRLCSGRIRR